MSVNKMKNLKLQRNNESVINVEDTLNILVAEAKTDRGEKSSKHQETLTPVHSTPKRSSSKSSVNQEQLEFRVSPLLLPCTQDGGNEVAWDWQSPLTKSTTSRKSRNNSEHIGTPKRTNLLQKKRNSNSPLLYKPIKRKLMKNDNQQECFKIFTAEMRALSEQIKTVPKEEENPVEPNESKNEVEEDLLIEIDIEDFDESETKLDPKSEKSTSARQKAPIGKTSLDDLFDDSIEESMVKCSQEVEEKLRLETCRKSPSRSSSSVGNFLKDFSWHQQSYTSFLASRDKSNNENKASSFAVTEGTRGASSSFSRLPTIKTEPKKIVAADRISSSPSGSNKSKSSTDKGANTLKPSSSCPSSNNVAAVKTARVVASTQNEIFEIPDDSFDEDFLAVSFDDVENRISEKPIEESNRSSNRYGKFYTSPHASAPSDGGANKVAGKSAKKLLPPPSKEASCNNFKAGGQNGPSKIFPRHSSNVMPENKPNSVKTSMIQQSQTSLSSGSMNSSRKFFKTKSLSTSNFDDHRSTDNRGTSSSSASASVVASGARAWKSNACPRSSLVSTEQQQQQPLPQQKQQQQLLQHRKTSPNELSNNALSMTNGEHNNGIKNFNRNAPRDDGNRLKMINDSAQRPNGVKEGATGSQSICTPEEIERKRQEARLKLEMKRKLQARSKSTGLLPDYSMKRPPVKR